MRTRREGGAVSGGEGFPDPAAAFRTWAAVVFLGLIAGLVVGMAVYWLAVLEPQLTAKAEVTARALARSHIHALSEVLARPEPAERKTRLLTQAMDRLLILTDPTTDQPFLLGVSLEVDYTTVPGPEGAFDLARGETGNPEALPTELPVYNPRTRELLGIARLHGSPAFFENFKADVRRTFAIGAAVGLVLLILVWRGVAVLLGRLRRTERDLREKQAQIVHAGRLTAMGEMATGIAHELNQPLAIIRVAADGLNAWFAKNRPEGGMEVKAARKIAEQTGRAAAIIDHMRAFARAESGPSGPADPIDPAEPVSRALSFFREQFRIRGIRLAVELGEDLPPVPVPEQKLEQIVVNLLSNARHAVEAVGNGGERGDSKSEKWVAVRLYSDSEADEVTLEVADNGEGMSPEVGDRCMEPFFTTKGVGEGTGLGLSIVHGIAREFGMTVAVESAEGEGAVFRVGMAGSRQNPSVGETS
jgi:signal transduction histidine kinase